ncbi:MAG: ABC transporter substrate-binding protein [Peptostreptococcaceae bacterium]
MKSKKIICLATIFALTSTLLVGCGKSKPSNEVLNIYNVGDYIDGDLITKFEEETGIKVVYETYDTNESMYQKVKSGSSKYDLVFPSDYMVEKMIKEGMLNEIDYSNIPNYKYIDETFKDAPYDKGDKHSVPYLWGTFGIVYNKKMVNEEDVKSWDVLWNEKYAGEIQMLDSVRDSMGIALKKLGYSMNSTDPKEIDAAKKELMKQKSIVQSYVNDDGKDRLVAEEAAMGIVYSGDAITLIESNDNLAYSVPEEGTNRWIDAMCIPTTAQNKDYAEIFINFMLDPENAAQNVEYIWYSTPNTGAIEILGEDYEEDSILNPSDEVIDKTEVFLDLNLDILKIYDNAWIEVKCE